MGDPSAILELKNVSKRFGGISVLEDVTLAVGKGEILGIIGPNGAGKTTLINIVTCSLKSDKGIINFKGRSVVGSKPHILALNGMTRTFQQSQVFIDFTVLENVMLPLFIKKENKNQSMVKALKILDYVGIDRSVYYKRPATLNQSDRKMLEFARAIAGEPDLVLLDEVMAGMSQSESEKVISLVKDLCQRGTSFIIVEHIMHIIRYLCHRIAALNAGRIIKDGLPDAVMDDPQVISAFMGESTDAES